jgi:glutamate-5-semialdehyde dehydrogenase
MAQLLNSERRKLQSENSRDLDASKKKGLSSAMIDRLTLSDKTITGMIQGLKEVAALPTSVGTTYDERIRPNGLIISKIRVPIGVVGIIYESRPNVTVDAAAICLKSHNAVILRGGSESFFSNRALASLFSKALAKAKLPSEAIQIIPTTDRQAIELLLKKDEYVDLIIPRGGESLIRMVVEKSHIPVIKHYKGICHVYISSSADIKKATAIVVNAKIQRPGVCNAMETLLLDAGLSIDKRRTLVNALLNNNVTLYGDIATRTLSPKIKRATKRDWNAEYLDLRLAVRTVNNCTEAIDHINTYGSHHTDAIITKSKTEADMFLSQVDSSSVMINASTRFSDGGQYGMGCEIGISTDKLHARGPMGVDDLTTYKWVVKGTGQIRT